MHPFAFRAFPSDEVLRHIFEQSSVGIFQSSLEGRNLVANPALARILGYDSPEDLQQGIRSVERDFYADPQRRREVNEMLARGGGRIDGLESRVRRKDGSIIWISESTRIVRDVETDAPIYLGSVSDVTARKLAELALVEREAQLRSEMARRRAAESALRLTLEEAIVACAVDGSIEFCTERAARLLRTHFAEDSRQRLPAALRDELERSPLASGTDEATLPTAAGRLQIRLAWGRPLGDLRVYKLSEPLKDGLLRAFAAHGLTPREADVLHWLMQGKSNAEIARILSLAEKTVKKHLERIYGKLGVENRTAAALLAGDRVAQVTAAGG